MRKAKTIRVWGERDGVLLPQGFEATSPGIFAGEATVAALVALLESVGVHTNISRDAAVVPVPEQGVTFTRVR